MFCSNCGGVIAKGQPFCAKCGAAADGAAAGRVRTSGTGVGFSSRINDPAFARYRRKSGKWSVLFTILIAAAAVIGFPLYGKLSGEIEWPSSLFYGIAIGAVFVVIALAQLLKRSMDKTWDGVVAYKNCYKKREQEDDSSIGQLHTIYVMKVQKDSGGTKCHKWRDAPGLYNYYNLGDKVRHHGGLYYYEKFDKSHDGQIMCAACLTFNEINQDSCKRCKCPLLK